MFQIKRSWREKALICFDNLLVIDGVFNLNLLYYIIYRPLFMQGGVEMNKMWGFCSVEYDVLLGRFCI